MNGERPGSSQEKFRLGKWGSAFAIPFVRRNRDRAFGRPVHRGGPTLHAAPWLETKQFFRLAAALAQNKFPMWGRRRRTEELVRLSAIMVCNLGWCYAYVTARFRLAGSREQPPRIDKR